MFAKYHGVVFSALFFLAGGCKPSVDTSSDEFATARGSAGQRQRCTQVYPDVKRVAVPIFQKIVAYAKSGRGAGTAGEVAKHTVTMLKNMMKSPYTPIHPLAFFATVKDFESAAVSQWAVGTASGASNLFTSRNCTSGQCYGLFQVDVRIEGSAWGGGSFCRDSGLGVWSLKGGPDFCASQFWWTVAQGGGKCSKLYGSGNPCRDPGLTWTHDHVRSGWEAYVQYPQWGANSWLEMYKNYESCITSFDTSRGVIIQRTETEKKALLKESVAEFKRDIGLDGGSLYSDYSGEPLYSPGGAAGDTGSSQNSGAPDYAAVFGTGTSVLSDPTLPYTMDTNLLDFMNKPSDEQN